METDPILSVASVEEWSRWLAANAAVTSGVWLVLAKKGSTEPMSLTYGQALEEALCFGWVDGQLAKGDERTFRRRFSPRRSTSAWSKRNVALVEQLISEGRMQASGLAVVDRAKADGSWEQAYEGQATIEMPHELALALRANGAAQQAFDQLSSANRYAILYRVKTAKRSETRQRRIEQFVAMLARGETLHPESKSTRGRSPSD